MSSLGEFFKGVKSAGKERIKENQKLRNKIAEKGEPHATILVDDEFDEEIRMWKIKGGVVTIYFVKGKANVSNIVTYTDEFIEALLKCKGNQV